MTKILITGGEGYLGGFLARSLKASGYTVKIGARSSGIGKTMIDLSCLESLRRACDGANIVIHLAAMNQHQCEQDFEQAIIINTLGTHKLFAAAKAAGVTRFFYFSTAQVYDTISDLLIDETSQTLSRNSYALTHEMAERCLSLDVETNQTKVTVIRLTNAFGSPGEPSANCWTLFVNNICRDLVEKKRIVIRSSPYIQRDFVTLTDLYAALKLLMFHPKSAGEIFNICSGNSIQLLDMAKIVQERAHVMLGIDASIDADTKNYGSLYQHPGYSNRKIRDLGFTFKNQIETEIDLLLVSCFRWFHKSGRGGQI